MGISFGSINTGLPKDIVQQIMNAERIPVKRMEDRKGKVVEKKGLVDELIGRMEAIRGHLARNPNARALRELKVNTKDDIIGVTADKSIAEPGTYQFEVLQLAQKSSAMTSGFADKDKSYVGVGFIQYYLPSGEKRELYVDQENASLTSIAALINKDSDNGLRANVINDGSGSDTPWRLILSLENTGDDNAAHFPYFYFVDGEQDLYLEFERKAHDAKVKLDGFEIELEGNNASELIPGVAIDLKKAAPGDEFAINISEDTDAVAVKVSEIIGSLNNVLQFIKEQNAMDETTDTTRTLGGDIVLQTLESRIRGLIFRDIQTSKGPKKMSDLGVTFQRDGLLELDETKFAASLKTDYTAVSEVLTGQFTENGKTKGFIDHMSDLTDTTLRFPDGLLASRKRSLTTNIDQIDRRINQRERLLEQKEQGLKNKFAALEGTIARIQGQGAGVAALGAAAPSVQQLG